MHLSLSESPILINEIYEQRKKQLDTDQELEITNDGEFFNAGGMRF